MDLMALVARLTLDSSEYEQGVTKAGGLISSLGKGITTAMGIGAAAVGAATTAVIGLAGASANGYAEIEQLRGGVKKLFGDQDAQTVIKNANNAFMTAGQSAQQYIDQVTSFSAALIGSLGGDTAAAAEKADVAMRAIADNFNTFGGDISGIQNAFQGFAKQNYTMLDNLKLGYGGTKTEMERLIADANEYAKSIGQASDLSIDSFADVVTAIDLIQQKQNIAGTTSKEAMTTVAGSIGMVKSAWENLVTGFSDPEANLEELISQVVESAEYAFENLIPVLEQGLEGIGSFVEQMGPIVAEKLPELVDIVLPSAINAAISLVSGVAATLPSLAETLINTLGNAIVTYGPGLIDTGKNIISNIGNGIIQNAPNIANLIGNAIDNAKTFIETQLPEFLNKGVDIILNMANGLMQGAPNVMTNIGDILNKLLEALIAAIPVVLEAGVKLIIGLAQGVIQSLPEIIVAAQQVVMQLLSTISEHLPELLAKGIELIAQLAAGIIQAIPNVVSGVNQVVDNIKQILTGMKEKALTWGKDMIQGFADGIKNGIKLVGDAVGKVAEKASSLLHFSRPDEGPLRYYEQWMPDFMKGLADGIESNMWRIEDAMTGVAGLMTVNPDASPIGMVGGTFAPVVSINVYASENQDAEEVGQAAVDEVNRQIQSLRGVWGHA